MDDLPPRDRITSRLHFFGNHGGTCFLQVSSNLIDWQTIRSFTGNDSGVELEDEAGADVVARFYRVITP
jgi:hypothetical protein